MVDPLIQYKMSDVPQCLAALSSLVSPSMSPLSYILAIIGGLYLIPATLALDFGFPYGSEKVRGVNLGGWLVLEVRYSRLSSEIQLTTDIHSLGLRHRYSTTQGIRG